MQPHESDATEVVRLALSGVHVNVTGPQGSDLPAMLGEVRDRLEERGLQVVSIVASTELHESSFAALRLALPELFADVRDPAAVIDRFCAFLSEIRSPYVVVDFIDQADPYTLRAISESMRRSSAVLISSLSSATARLPVAVVAQPHSQVVARGFSHLDLEAWLNGMTPHPLELELVTRIYVETRGLPRFSRVVFLSGIRADQIVLRDGWWGLDAGELWTPEISFALASAVTPLPEALRECLAAVHREGTPTVSSLLSRFATATVTGLEREGLIGVFRGTAGEPQVTVTPPILGRYLDDELGGVLRASRPARDPLEADLDEELVMSIVLARTTAQRATTARTAFGQERTPEHALELVHALWARGAPYDEAAEVFASAPDDLDLLILHARWLAFGAGRFDDALSLLDAASHHTGEAGLILSAHRVLISVFNSGLDPATQALIEELEGLSTASTSARFARLTLASAHLLAGRARTALAVAGDVLPDDLELRPLWTFITGYSLLTADEPARAFAMASETLERGRDDLDPDLVFTASYVLIACHMFLGNWGQAQRLAKAVRAIGRPNLHTIGVYRTTLGMQAVVFAEEGELEIADGLIRAIQQPGARPLAFGQAGMPSVVRLLATRDYDELALVLASTAEAAHVNGSEYPSSFLWAFAMAMDPRLVDRSPAVSATGELDAYERLRGFVLTLQDGDPVRIREAAASYPQSTFAYLAGLALLRTGHRVRESDPAVAAYYEDWAHALWQRLSIPPPVKVIQGPVPVLGLTGRELQVALLVARLTNREIADRLGVSERTVDHHVSNALRKSGARNRRELSALVGRIRGEW